MGSEMCIRDSHIGRLGLKAPDQSDVRHRHSGLLRRNDQGRLLRSCLLYTSDAADERSSVDLGGRRIIKKKKHSITHEKVLTS